MFDPENMTLRRLINAGFLLALIWLTSCGEQDQSSATPIAIGSEVAVPLATPSLAPGLPTAPPQAPTLAPGETPPTATPTLTPTPSPTATPTPLPGERVAIAQRDVTHGNLVEAADQFEAGLADAAELSRQEQSEALLSLGVSYFNLKRYSVAVTVFQQLEQLHGGTPPLETSFYLGRAHQEMGQTALAVEAFQRYLAENPEMGAYVGPFLAAAHWTLGNDAAAISTLESSLDSAAYPPKAVELRERLAGIYLESGRYTDAAEQYAAARLYAASDRTQGRLNHLEGYARLLAGDLSGGYDRYLAGLSDYPRAYESYQGLLALIDAGYAVSDYDRGVVDYYAEMYDPAIAAFQRLFQSGTAYPADAHKFMAWSLERMGDLAGALDQLAAFQEAEPAQGLIEQAKMQARGGLPQEAVASYLAYLDAFPTGEQGAFAAWWAAALTEGSGDTGQAIVHYRNLAEMYPEAEDAPEALFRAGWLAFEVGQLEQAETHWRRAALEYPNTHYGSAALFWLYKSIETASPPTDATQEPYPAAADEGEVANGADALAVSVTELIADSRSDEYYALRAKDLADGLAPFAGLSAFSLPESTSGGQAEAEAALRAALGFGATAGLDSLDSMPRTDSRLVVGEKLWRIGLLEDAKRELESLRVEYKDDPLRSYQLALYFRDLGLYRSSILAAESVLKALGWTLFEAPKFLGRLAYPTYYADLILPLADKYRFDPRLQFALVRQESLFESFARSGAAAQGLAQVIPDTGEYIAERLNWPDYSNEDLYKPYVGLAFGAYYLSQQLAYFDDQVHVALSAYNGGPGNAARWYAQAPSDFDAYLETVDFSETRLYIERIYVGFAAYRYLYGE